MSDYWEKSDDHVTVMLWISVATFTLYQITDFRLVVISLFILLCDHTYILKFQHDIFNSSLHGSEGETSSSIY